MKAYFVSESVTDVNESITDAPDNPTNHLLLEVEEGMSSPSNKRELNL
jgi:hypothetical protein